MTVNESYLLHMNALAEAMSEKRRKIKINNKNKLSVDLN
jgi:hypothetical protein